MYLDKIILTKHICLQLNKFIYRLTFDEVLKYIDPKINHRTYNAIPSFLFDLLQIKLKNLNLWNF